MAVYLTTSIQRRSKVNKEHSDNRQPAQSYLTKRFSADGSQIAYRMEVRTENLGGGSIRLGEIIMRGTMSGQMMVSLHGE